LFCLNFRPLFFAKPIPYKDRPNREGRDGVKVDQKIKRREKDKKGKLENL
jgi:hypothetical protein